MFLVALLDFPLEVTVVVFECTFPITGSNLSGARKVKDIQTTFFVYGQVWLNLLNLP
jgi:hypothetical protein